MKVVSHFLVLKTQYGFSQHILFPSRKFGVRAETVWVMAPLFTMSLIVNSQEVLEEYGLG